MSRPLKPPVEKELGTRVATLEQSVESVREDFANLRQAFDNSAAKQDNLFNQVFARIDSIRTRPVPWGIYFAAASVVITVAGALAGWANAYFGERIERARSEAAAAQVQAARVEERLEKTRDVLNATQLSLTDERATTRTVLDWLRRDIDRGRGPGDTRAP